MNPLPLSFALACNRGPIAIGRFEKPEFHKEEGENLLSKFGIDIEYGESVDYGTGMAPSDFDHARLIGTYIDHAYKVRDTARALKRSPHTVMRHIENHRREVLRDRSCARCRRVNGRESSNALNKSTGGGDLLEEITETSVP
jgi:hypothetical protein